MIVAALFVETGGVYYGLPDVDPWDRARDARLYPGPHPVVAHPPCERWGRYWSGGPSAKTRRRAGDDEGCFAAALAAVRAWGGVLEHPESSKAWSVFDLPRPLFGGGWVRSLYEPRGWSCCVEQGHYGHRARKATWLYAYGIAEPPVLRWGTSGAKARIDPGYHSAEERRRCGGAAPNQRLLPNERVATPERFRDLLLDIARQTARHRMSA